MNSHGHLVVSCRPLVVGFQPIQGIGGADVLTRSIYGFHELDTHLGVYDAKTNTVVEFTDADAKIFQCRFYADSAERRSVSTTSASDQTALQKALEQMAMKSGSSLKHCALAKVDR